MAAMSRLQPITNYSSTTAFSIYQTYTRKSLLAPLQRKLPFGNPVN